MSLTLDSLPLRRTEVRRQNLPDGSVLLFDTRTSDAIAISQSAALVWEACDGAHPVATIADQLFTLYEAPHDQIVADVISVLNDFTARGLLL